MVGKGNLAVLESSNISKTGEAMPTKIGVHALDINPYLHEFFEPIPINSLAFTFALIKSSRLRAEEEEPLLNDEEFHSPTHIVMRRESLIFDFNI